MIGQILDQRYRIISKLGEGGMGEVYSAEHIHIEKRVAIKLLRREIVTNEEAVRRFRQEARSASSIGHRNIVAIEDFGTLADGRIYLCMELLDGRPLNTMLEQPIPTHRLLDILIETGQGLAAAHAKGIVHRDMKPENIFVIGQGGRDVPKLLDFGIAKVSQSEGANHLTRTGTIFGTPFYMSPEQALGHPVDHRADIYAMGVILYECLCGAVPFQGESFMGILTQHVTAEPKPPGQVAAAHGRTLPPGSEEIIAKAMRKEPGDRYSSMEELVHALIEVRDRISDPHAAAGRDATRGGLGPAATTAAAQDTPYPEDLRSASAVTVRGARDWRAVAFAAAALVAVAGGSAAFWMTRQDNHPAALEGAAAVEDPPVAAEGERSQQPALSATMSKPGGAIGAAAPTREAAGQGANAAPTTVLLFSQPAGARVYEDGKRIGKTPLNLDIEAARPRVLVLKLRRHKDLSLVLDGSETRVQARLRRQRDPRTGAKTGASSGEEKDEEQTEPGEPGAERDPETLEKGVVGGGVPTLP